MEAPAPSQILLPASPSSYPTPRPLLGLPGAARRAGSLPAVLRPDTLHDTGERAGCSSSIQTQPSRPLPRSTDLGSDGQQPPPSGIERSQDQPSFPLSPSPSPSSRRCSVRRAPSPGAGKPAALSIIKNISGVIFAMSHSPKRRPVQSALPTSELLAPPSPSLPSWDGARCGRLLHPGISPAAGTLSSRPS